MYRLSDLYPLPPLYNGLRRSDTPAWAQAFAAYAAPFAAPHVTGRGLPPSPGSPLAAAVEAASLAGPSAGPAPPDAVAAALTALYRQCVELAAAPDPADQLYPVNLAAGVLLADGRTLVAREDKGLEYGCTVEAPVQLTLGIRAAAAGGVAPLAMLQVDQWGVCHAPHARARAWLSERGYGGVVVYAHDRSGALVRTTAERLAPAGPAIVLVAPPPAGDAQSPPLPQAGATHACGCA